MADIELVIRISEELYGQLIELENPTYLAQCVIKGKQLPKGHGRLIDAYEIIEQANNMADELDNNFTIADIEKVGTLLESISTIIEADKESDEGYANDWIGYISESEEV